MATHLTPEEIEVITPEQIEELSSVKTIMSVFTNGKNGMPIKLPEMKSFDKEERDALASECKEDFVANCKA